MASAEEAGQIKWRITDTQEQGGRDALTFGTNGVSQAARVPVGVNAQALPRVPISASVPKGRRLVVTFTPVATDIVESEECGAIIPVTFYDEKTMQPVYSQNLTFDDLTGFTAAGTVDTTATAATPTRLAHFVAPVGYYIGLQAGAPYHTYMGDDTA